MKRDGEAGVSLVEILIATFILFFVVAAIMGLLSMTFIMAAGSRNQSAATAFLNRQIEEIRAMSYPNIGIQGGDPNGTLAASETMTYAGIQFTITRSVEWVDDVADNTPQTAGGSDSDRHDYKSVTVRLTWHNARGADQTLTINTSIREPWADTNPPMVEFTGSNVPAGSIVYGQNIVNGGTLAVQGDANDNLDAAGQIASLIFYVDGRVLRNPGYSPTTASWAPGTKTFTNPAYPWNTLAVDESSTPLYRDGTRELKVEAWDNSGARDFKIINVIVDNYAPDAPSNLAAVVATANSSCYSTARLSWTGAMDGTDWADQYQIERTKNGSADGSITATGSLTDKADSTLAPFSVYSYRMRALSPRSLGSDYTEWTGSQMTRPRLTGTVSGNGNSRTAALTWTGPSFAVTSAQYKVHQATTWSSGNITSAPVTTVNHPTVTWTTTSYLKANEYYWQIEATYVVSGTTYTTWSNVIGKSGLSGAVQTPP